jgi:hypothetical protein
LELGGGTSNTTVYGALHCNWNTEGEKRTEVAEMVKVVGVGKNTSVFGLRDNGAALAINQRGVSQLPSRGSWFGVLADVDITHSTA